MPTGPSHYRTTVTRVRGDGTDVNDFEYAEVECRCILGEDHSTEGVAHSAMFLDDDADDETLSVNDAAEIWRSKGMDEDYMFGYSESELRSAGG